MVHYEKMPLYDTLEKVRNGEILKAVYIFRGDSLSSEKSDTAEYNVDSEFACFEDISFPKGSFVYPGSFNPLHSGHIALVVAALKSAGWSGRGEDQQNAFPVIFEIAVVNADKPSLNRDEIVRRLRQFSTSSELFKAAGLQNFAVCITSAPYFVSKAEIFNNCNFILGVDTLARLLHSKYYENSEMCMVAAFATMKAQGISFIVGGRICGSNENESEAEFMTVDSVMLQQGSSLPSSVKAMFKGLNEEDFRADISSTEIRNSLK